MLVLSLVHLSYLLLGTLPLACPVEEPVHQSSSVCLILILNIRSCMCFTKSVFCLSTVALCVMSGSVSFALSCGVFCICCSSNLKSRRGHCSLILALLPPQSLLYQSDGVTEGCETLYLKYIHSF